MIYIKITCDHCGDVIQQISFRQYDTVEEAPMLLLPCCAKRKESPWARVSFKNEPSVAEMSRVGRATENTRARFLESGMHGTLETVVSLLTDQIDAIREDDTGKAE